MRQSKPLEEVKEASSGCRTLKPLRGKDEGNVRYSGRRSEAKINQERGLTELNGRTHEGYRWEDGRIVSGMEDTQATCSSGVVQRPWARKELSLEDQKKKQSLPQGEIQAYFK